MNRSLGQIIIGSMFKGSSYFIKIEDLELTVGSVYRREQEEVKGVKVGGGGGKNRNLRGSGQGGWSLKWSKRAIDYI